MLFDSVVQAAMRVAATKTTAGVVSASVATLAEGVLKAMFVTRLKTITLGLMALGVVAVGVGSLSPASPQRPEEDRAQTPSGAANEPEQGKRPDPGRPSPKQVPVKPGSLLRIEVLEALPGRPLSGLRPVRPDGTISLDYYGDLYVAGMTREEIKAKLVEHLRKQLPDEILGLIEQDANGKIVEVEPKDSNRVFVDDNVFQPGMQEQRLERLERKLDQALRSQAATTAQAESGRKVPRPASPVPVRAGSNPSLPPLPAPAPTESDQERRLGEVERKLDQILKMLEGSKRDEGR
jgi:hypothetical protein